MRTAVPSACPWCLPRSYYGDTMFYMKVAISVPDPVFEAGEHLARQLKLSRSQLYSDALAAYLSSRGASAVTAQLNAVYAATVSRLDESVAAAQEKSLSHETW
jgi:hypothetical protein